MIQISFAPAGAKLCEAFVKNGRIFYGVHANHNEGGVWMKRKRRERAERIVQSIVQQPASDTDPQGSWTGRPENEDEIPVQDADDL